MQEFSDKKSMREFFSDANVKLIFRHAKFGIWACGIGLALLALLILLHGFEKKNETNYLWSALLSIPVTIICMGLFSVFYEYYIRAIFSKSMRSMYWAWGTGVTVLPSHSDAPARKDVLEIAEKDVSLLSTTFSQYFNDVRDGVDQKASNGVKFRFIIYDPDSSAIEEKAKEESCHTQDFKDEISSVCRRYLGPLVKRYPNNIEVRFCNFNTPFGITIVDEKQMVLSLNIYGLARSKNETPCLIIENTHGEDSVFKLYENSFEAVWEKLDKSVPKSLQQYFTVDE